jgi:general secretion pathway protein I
VNSRQRGFGLLEMLAALAVFGLACTILLVAFGQAARTLEQVRASDRLSLQLRSRIDELRDRPLEPGTTRGVEGGMAWHIQVTREPGPASALPLYRLQVTVNEAGRELRAATWVVQSPPGTPL